MRRVLTVLVVLAVLAVGAAFAVNEGVKAFYRSDAFRNEVRDAVSQAIEPLAPKALVYLPEIRPAGWLDFEIDIKASVGERQLGLKAFVDLQTFPELFSRETGVIVDGHLTDGSRVHGELTVPWKAKTLADARGLVRFQELDAPTWLHMVVRRDDRVRCTAGRVSGEARLADGLSVKATVSESAWELDGGARALVARPMDVDARGDLTALTLTHPLVWQSAEGKASLQGSLRAPKGAGLSYDFSADTEGEIARGLVAVLFNCKAAPTSDHFSIKGSSNSAHCG